MATLETSSVVVCKPPFQLDPDDRRVITRMFELNPPRMARVVERVLTFDSADVERMCAALLEDYGHRHRRIRDVFSRHYAVVARQLRLVEDHLSEERKLLIGAYFTMEYAVESAALFNPSIVSHPDQSGVPDGQVRVALSLRAVGEGHVSSIEFRAAMIDAAGGPALEPVNTFLASAKVRPDQYFDKHLYSLKLLKLMTPNEGLGQERQIVARSLAEETLEQLGERFTLDELRYAIWAMRAQYKGNMDVLEDTFSSMLWLARSNYEIQFEEDSLLSERVIFPISSTEAAGIEDARFVRFVEDDGQATYYATYTAYDGRNILTQLLETKDFLRFKVHTLNGVYAESKGMALFPRRVNGRYAMISRVDGENLFIMYSDNIHFWDHVEPLQMPLFPWEAVQIGNCGSPIETEEGWLMLTHGVGAMRRYCIGAVLLELNNPSKIIGRLPEPLLAPAQDEREGYVPNVVYSCGAMIHNKLLVIPYAFSDSASRVATVPIRKLLDALTSPAARAAQENAPTPNPASAMEIPVE
jgi:predicted GH43/DUF377 family glycosyl hydrolase